MVSPSLFSFFLSFSLSLSLSPPSVHSLLSSLPPPCSSLCSLFSLFCLCHFFVLSSLITSHVHSLTSLFPLLSSHSLYLLLFFSRFSDADGTLLLSKKAILRDKQKRKQRQQQKPLLSAIPLLSSITPLASSTTTGTAATSSTTAGGGAAGPPSPRKQAQQGLLVPVMRKSFSFGEVRPVSGRRLLSSDSGVRLGKKGEEEEEEAAETKEKEEKKDEKKKEIEGKRGAAEPKKTKEEEKGEEEEGEFFEWEEEEEEEEEEGKGSTIIGPTHLELSEIRARRKMKRMRRERRQKERKREKAKAKALLKEGESFAPILPPQQLPAGEMEEEEEHEEGQAQPQQQEQTAEQQPEEGEESYEYNCLVAKTALIFSVTWDDLRKPPGYWIEKLLARRIIDAETGEAVPLWEITDKLPMEVAKLNPQFRQMVGWKERHLYYARLHQNTRYDTFYSNTADSAHASTNAGPSSSDNNSASNSHQSSHTHHQQTGHQPGSSSSEFQPVWKSRKVRLTDYALRTLFPRPKLWAYVQKEDEDNFSSTDSENEHDSFLPSEFSEGENPPSPDIQEGDREEEEYDTSAASASGEEYYQATFDSSSTSSSSLVSFNADITDVELVFYPLGTGLLIFHLNWLTNNSGLSLDELRTLLFLSKFRHCVTDLFLGWTLGPSFSSKKSKSKRDKKKKKKKKLRKDRRRTDDDFPFKPFGRKEGDEGEEGDSLIRKTSSSAPARSYSINSDSSDIRRYGAGANDDEDSSDGKEHEEFELAAILSPSLQQRRSDNSLDARSLRLTKRRSLVVEDSQSDYDEEHHECLGLLATALYEDNPISLTEIGDWLLHFTDEDPAQPPHRIIQSVYANHHTTVVVDREMDEEEIKEYLFHLRRAYGQGNRPPPPDAMAKHKQLDQVLIPRFNRYIGIAREGTVALSWPINSKNIHFETQTWPQLFQGIYLVLGQHVHGERVVLLELSNLAAYQAENLKLESETGFEGLKAYRTQLRDLATLMLRYSLGMSSDDCGGLSEYAHFFSTLRKVYGIPAYRMELSEEIRGVLGIVESGFLEEQRRLKYKEKAESKRERLLRAEEQKLKDNQNKRLQNFISVIGAIALPIVIVSGVFGMNVEDLPIDVPFWYIILITSGVSIVILLLLFAINYWTRLPLKQARKRMHGYTLLPHTDYFNGNNAPSTSTSNHHLHTDNESQTEVGGESGSSGRASHEWGRRGLKDSWESEMSSSSIPASLSTASSSASLFSSYPMWSTGGGNYHKEPTSIMGAGGAAGRQQRRGFRPIRWDSQASFTDE
ncbi:X8 domain-containing protein, variant 2 [Balamuthia mandrillaris]